MGTIINFQSKARGKFGFKRVKRRRKSVDLEKHGQLNLFNAPPHEARIVQFKSPIGLFERALQLDDQNDSKVKEAYQKAIEAEDCLADAYCNLGIIEFKEGNTVKAIDCFTKSLKLDPRHFESHYNLANLYSEIDDLKLAAVHYQMAAEVRPDYANLYYNLGLVQAMQEDVKDAIKSLEKFRGLSPKTNDHNADELLASLRKSVELNHIK